MPNRSLSQKLGSNGQHLVASLIAAQPDWIVRHQLQEDFGIDMEAELSDPNVTGQLLKIQVKSARRTVRRSGVVLCRVKKQLLEYAYICRLPVILTVADLTTKSVVFLWLQGWMYEQRISSYAFAKLPDSLTLRIPLTHDLDAGLRSSLKEIAAWKTSIQLALTLQDAFRTAISIGDDNTCLKLFEALKCVDAQFTDFPTETLIAEILKLGGRVWATTEGNRLTGILFELCRTFGDRFTAAQIKALVIRGKVYSRIGINALGILYDTFSEHIAALNLSDVFSKSDPRIIWYCKFRERMLGKSVWEILKKDPNFTIRNLRIDQTMRVELVEKWANRGDSALLDCLSLSHSR